MALSVTFTGRPLVANEDDRSITFTDLGLDWAGEGYTLALRVTDPDGTAVEHSLVAVVGTATSAKLSSVSGVFTQDGVYTLKVIAYSGTDPRLYSVDYYVYVRP